MALFGSSDDDLRRRIEVLERRVAMLERAAGLGPQHSTPYGEPAVSDGVRNLALGGKKIAAIKLLRDETGLGLKDAKNIVDKLI